MNVCDCLMLPLHILQILTWVVGNIDYVSSRGTKYCPTRIVLLISVHVFWLWIHDCLFSALFTFLWNEVTCSRAFCEDSGVILIYWDGGETDRGGVGVDNWLVFSSLLVTLFVTVEVTCVLLYGWIFIKYRITIDKSIVMTPLLYYKGPIVCCMECYDI